MSSSANPRISMVSWNVDGLSEVLHAELKKWLAEHADISVLMLQETHWSFTGE